MLDLNRNFFQRAQALNYQNYLLTFENYNACNVFMNG